MSLSKSELQRHVLVETLIKSLESQRGRMREVSLEWQKIPVFDCQVELVPSLKIKFDLESS